MNENMDTSMCKIVYYENILEFKENTQSQLQYNEVKNWNLCRTCLQDTQAISSTDFSGDGICLVGIDGQFMNVKDMLSSVTGLQISEKDRLPAKICKLCLSKISAWYFFKLQIQRAETVLRKLLFKLDETKNFNQNSEVSPNTASEIIINEADCSNNDLDEKEEFVSINTEPKNQDEELLESDHDFELENSSNEETVLIPEDLTEDKNEVEIEFNSQEVYDVDNKLSLEYHTNDSIEEYVYGELEPENDENTDSDTITFSLTLKPETANSGERNNEEKQGKPKNHAEKICSKNRYKKGSKALLSDLTCVICKMSFPQQQMLIAHVNADHPNTKAFKCRTCGQMFSHLQSLSRHMQTHLEKKSKKVCGDCGKSFLRSDDWRRHQRTHTGERPYICKICQKGFKQVSELKEHSNTHIKTKRYVCNICGHCLQSRNGLYLHKKVHDGIKNHVCDYCQKRFITKGELRSHLNVHTKVKKINAQVDIE